MGVYGEGKILLYVIWRENVKLRYVMSGFHCTYTFFSAIPGSTSPRYSVSAQPSGADCVVPCVPPVLHIKRSSIIAARVTCFTYTI
jgi:hypothetical protein